MSIPLIALLLYSELRLKFADRGVRVRFLLDDISTEAPNRALLPLNQHANIEVRVFNPISRSGISWLPTKRINYPTKTW